MRGGPLQGGERGVRGPEKTLSVLFASFVFFVLKNPRSPARVTAFGGY
jgi:hypothetical protein